MNILPCPSYLKCGCIHFPFAKMGSTNVLNFVLKLLYIQFESRLPTTFIKKLPLYKADDLEHLKKNYVRLISIIRE